MSIALYWSVDKGLCSNPLYMWLYQLLKNDGSQCVVIRGIRDHGWALHLKRCFCFCWRISTMGECYAAVFVLPWCASLQKYGCTSGWGSCEFSVNTTLLFSSWVERGIAAIPLGITVGQHLSTPTHVRYSSFSPWTCLSYIKEVNKSKLSTPSYNAAQTIPHYLHGLEV